MSEIVYTETEKKGIRNKCKEIETGNHMKRENIKQNSENRQDTRQ